MSKALDRRAFLAAAAPVAVGAWAIQAGTADAVSPDPLGSFNLRDYGAVGDGVANDAPALQAALNAVGVARGGVLVIPPGTYLIASPVAKSFVDQASVVVIEGRGSGSQLVIRVGAANDGITIAGAESVLLDNLVVTGTPGVATDAKAALRLDSCVQAALHRCDFYGVSSQVAGGAVLQANQCDLRIFQCAFRGCSGSSALATPVIDNQNWRGLSVIETDFIDYGTLNGTFVTKTPITPGSAWIRVGNTFPLTDCNKQQTVVIENVRMDEGAQFGLLCWPNLSQSPRVANVVISGLRVCASGISAARAVYILNTERVRIEHSWFGYTTTEHEAIKLQNVGDAVIDSCRCEAGANVIAADAATTSLTVSETVYGKLNSDAKRTTVISSGQVAAFQKSGADVPPNSLVSWSTDANERIVVTPAGADASSVIGVSLDGVAADTGLRVVRDHGAVVQVRSDGSAPIQPGDALGVSPNVPGRVRRAISGGIVGRAAASAPAHSGVVVLMTLMPGVAGSDAVANASFVNGWANYGMGFGPATYYRDAAARVHLAGVVRPGTTTPDTAIFTLPVGYRPISDGLFAAATSDGVVNLRVKAGGDVTLAGGTVSTFVSLDGISFRAQLASSGV
ncbi:MAG: glycosyl hydrolase family 28-related protein [Acidimicrobiales bacterium]